MTRPLDALAVAIIAQIPLGYVIGRYRGGKAETLHLYAAPVFGVLSVLAYLAAAKMPSPWMDAAVTIATGISGAGFAGATLINFIGRGHRRRLIASISTTGVGVENDIAGGGQ